jgi:tetratricopeptide (TPR) repeat protein
MRRVFFSSGLCVICFSLSALAAVAQNPGGGQPPPGNASTPTSVAASPSLDDAQTLYRTAKYDAAAEEYNSLIAASPQTPLAYTGLARVYIKLGRLNDAHIAATKAAEIAPSLADAHVAMGEVYFRQGKIPEAEQEFFAMVRQGTSNARAYLGMARISEVDSYYKQAKAMIDEARALDPKDPDIGVEWVRSLAFSERTESLAEILAVQANAPAEVPEKREEGAMNVKRLSSLSSRPCNHISKTHSMQTNLIPMMVGPVQYHGYGLDVKVNGISSKLMVDTGASGIVIDRKIAEKAKITKITESNLSGIGDKAEAAGFIGVADSVKIGDLEFQGCVVEVIERNSVVGDDGVIGADIFSQYLVDLNFSDAKLKLTELPAPPEQPESASGTEPHPDSGSHLHNRTIDPEMKSFTPVYRFGHALLLSTQINDGTKNLFLLDTGAAVTSISPNTARDVTKVSVDEDSRIVGINGKVKNVYSSDNVTLTFANMRQKNQDLITFDTSSLSNSLGTEVSGIIGFVTLYRLDIKIDYRDGLVKFDFDKKHWHNYSSDGGPNH